MAKVIMNSNEYIERLEKIAARSTYYSNKYPYNLCYIHEDGRTSADCWNLIKAILNGYNVNNLTVGYYQKDLSNTGDCDGATLMSKCSDVSTNFTTLVDGVPELLYMNGHAGSFIGYRNINGHEYNVIECTGSWERKVLYSWVDSDGTRRRWKGGATNGKWLKHGKMTPWVDYSVAPIPTPTPTPQPSAPCNGCMPLIKKGNKGNAVKIWQTILVCNGYKISIDSDFGQATEKSTKDFQKNKLGVDSDGIVGKNTWYYGFKSIK